MAKPYYTYFDNPFLHLRMDRPAFKAQAQFSLTTVRQADLGAAMADVLTELETALAGFDENLTDRNQSTAGGTETFRVARAAWLAFVDDTMKDYVTPKLRKLPIYADFKAFGKSKLAALDQPTMLTQSKGLVDLYRSYQSQLYPTLLAEARQRYDALALADLARTQQEGLIDAAILDLGDDRLAIARAQRRLKAQLELAFEEPEKVYSFFDFSASKEARQARKKDEPKP